MNLLVVYCHPSPKSFVASLKCAVVERITHAGHDVVVHDLYAEGFDPVLSPQEFAAYHTVGDKAGGLKRHIETLAWAEGLVLIYPTWWYGMPALMKGYLDRVWLPGVAFGLDPQGRVTTDFLGNIRRFLVVTTYGSPWAWIRLGLGDPGRKAVQRGLHRLFAKSCRSAWLALYDMDRNTPAARAAFQRRVTSQLAMFET